LSSHARQQDPNSPPKRLLAATEWVLPPTASQEKEEGMPDLPSVITARKSITRELHYVRSLHLIFILVFSLSVGSGLKEEPKKSKKASRSLSTGSTIEQEELEEDEASPDVANKKKKKAASDMSF